MPIKKEEFLADKSNYEDADRFYLMCKKCKGKANAVPCKCLCGHHACRGDKCGSNKVVAYFKCYNCGWISDTTEDADKYIDAHLD